VQIRDVWGYFTVKNGNLRSLMNVFDFGDRIEHTLTLEAIVPTEKGKRYPRVTATSKPNSPKSIQRKNEE